MTTKATARPRDGERLDQARLFIGVVAVGLLAVLVWAVFDSRDDVEREQAEKLSLAQQVTTACEAGGAAARELESIGACASAATAAVGAPADDQPPALAVATDGQVRTAVTEYLRDNPPRDGRTPTAVEVDAAVTRVCGAVGCRGAVGPSGPGGSDGANASDDQVAAQVSDYCSRNDGCLPTPEQIAEAVRIYCSATPSPCVGPQGAQGERGEPGPVLPEYRETDALTGTTRHCELQPAEDAAEPPRYECTQE